MQIILRELSLDQDTAGNSVRDFSTKGASLKWNGAALPLIAEENVMETPMYPQSTVDIARKRRELAPEPLKAFKAFSAAVFAAGALPVVTKQLIAVAVAHVTQCPYCIRGHTAEALKHGASEQQIMEAIWVAAEMRAGAAYAHSTLALDTMEHAHQDDAAPG